MKGKKTTVTTHDEAVKSVVCSDNQIYSGSWDRTVKRTDVRSLASVTVDLPERVYSMDVNETKLVVALAERMIYIYDLRNFSEPLQKRESALKYQTRIVKCTLDGEGFVSSSTEGRVAVDFFDTNEDIQARKYAFKCHRDRQSVPGKEIVYPVNAIAFHPVFGTFASGGSDGVVNVWDMLNKKKIKQIGTYPTCISSLAFNLDGSCLAIASSYTFDQGPKDHPPDTIYVRSVSESEVAPKK
jgi:cell cycle arrest protein BUB3